MFNYTIVNEKLLPLQNIEKVNSGIFLDKHNNVVDFSKDLQVEVAYTINDLIKEIDKIGNVYTVKEFAEKYGLYIYYSNDESKDLFLAYYDCFNDNDFVIDVKTKEIYDVSSHSKNIMTEQYFVHDDIVIPIVYDDTFMCDHITTILNINEEIQPYQYYNIGTRRFKDVLIVNGYYGLVFNGNVVFICQEDYNKIVGNPKHYYVIRSGNDYEIFRSNGIEYVDVCVFEKVKVYKSNYKFDANTIIDNTFIYCDNTLFRIDHLTKTIDVEMKDCETIVNEDFVFFINKDKVIRIIRREVV